MAIIHMHRTGKKYISIKGTVNKSKAWNRGEKMHNNPNTEWPKENADTVYEYQFQVWPEERHPRFEQVSRSIYPLFDMFPMIYMNFKEKDFNEFREDLAKVGLSLREITRMPLLLPAGVF